MFKVIAKVSFLLSFLFACSTISKQRPTERPKIPKGINKELQKYVDSFIKEMSPEFDEKALQKTDMAFVLKLEGRRVGECWWPDKNGHRMILIKRDSWIGYSESKREQLIFHELGHCVCNLGHEHFQGKYETDENPPMKDKLLRGYFNDNCPVTIMYPSLIDTKCYKRHKAHYLYEIRIRCYAQKINKRYEEGD